MPDRPDSSEVTHTCTGKNATIYIDTCPACQTKCIHCTHTYAAHGHGKCDVPGGCSCDGFEASVKLVHRSNDAPTDPSWDIESDFVKLFAAFVRCGWGETSERDRETLVPMFQALKRKMMRYRAERRAPDNPRIFDEIGAAIANVEVSTNQAWRDAARENLVLRDTKGCGDVDSYGCWTRAEGIDGAVMSDSENDAIPRPIVTDLGWRIVRGQTVAFCPTCGFGMHADQSTPINPPAPPDIYVCPICKPANLFSKSLQKACRTLLDAWGTVMADEARELAPYIAEVRAVLNKTALDLDNPTPSNVQRIDPHGDGRVHLLKCWPAPFHDMRAGLKPFEYRKHDRDYRVGDVLWLNEYEPNTKKMSGDFIRRRVTYLLPGGTFGVPEGYCVMGVAPIDDADSDYPRSDREEKAIELLEEALGWVPQTEEGERAFHAEALEFLGRGKP